MGNLLTINGELAGCSCRSNNSFHVAFDGSLGESSGTAELTTSFVRLKRQQHNTIQLINQ